MVPFRSPHHAWNAQLGSRLHGGDGSSDVGIGVALRQAGPWWGRRRWARDENTCTLDGSCHNSNRSCLGTGNQTYTLAAAEGRRVLGCEDQAVAVEATRLKMQNQYTSNYTNLPLYRTGVTNK